MEWGEGTGGSTIARIQNVKYALTFIGLKDATAFTLEHESGHDFIGNTLGKTGFFKNLLTNTYINDFVLPHFDKYAPELRDFSQQILNP